METDLYTMSDDARRRFLAARYHAEAETYRDVNSQLANHFRRPADHRSTPALAIKERLRQAHLYHTFWQIRPLAQPCSVATSRPQKMPTSWSRIPSIYPRASNITRADSAGLLCVR